MSTKKDSTNLSFSRKALGKQIMKNGLSLPVTDAKDLECTVTVKETWEEYFKNYGNPEGLEDFMADREQDTPRDIDL